MTDGAGLSNIINKIIEKDMAYSLVTVVYLNNFKHIIY